MSDIRERFDREKGPGGLEARGYTVEARASDESDAPTISGLGSPYDSVSRIEGWFEDWDEVVAEGAWRNTITRDNADIVSTFNHNLDQLLARTTAGTLTLEDPSEGLKYTAQINPDDPQAMGIHARVARRDVTGSSVWFRVTKDQWEEPTDDNNLEVPVRTIMEAELFEVGPVVFPAFPTTTSEAASFQRLGYTRGSLAALNGALAAAGVTRNAKRASYASRFLADPDQVEEDLRTLFARNPDLRNKVCDDRAAAAARKGAPQPQVSLQLNEELYQALIG